MYPSNPFLDFWIPVRHMFLWRLNRKVLHLPPPLGSEKNVHKFNVEFFYSNFLTLFENVHLKSEIYPQVPLFQIYKYNTPVDVFVWRLNRKAKYHLEKDLADKFTAMRIDEETSELRNNSAGLHFAPGAAKISAK